MLRRTRLNPKKTTGRSHSNFRRSKIQKIYRKIVDNKKMVVYSNRGKKSCLQADKIRQMPAADYELKLRKKTYET